MNNFEEKWFEKDAKDMYFSVDFENLQNLLQSMAPKHMQKNVQKAAAPTNKIFIKTK